MKSIAFNVRTLILARLARGETQTECARKCGKPVTAAALSKIEAGEYTPGPKVRAALRRHFRIPAEKLFGMTRVEL